MGRHAGGAGHDLRGHRGSGADPGAAAVRGQHDRGGGSVRAAAEPGPPVPRRSPAVVPGGRRAGLVRLAGAAQARPAAATDRRFPALVAAVGPGRPERFAGRLVAQFRRVSVALPLVLCRFHLAAPLAVALNPILWAPLADARSPAWGSSSAAGGCRRWPGCYAGCATSAWGCSRRR